MCRVVLFDPIRRRNRKPDFAYRSRRRQKREKDALVSVVVSKFHFFSFEHLVNIKHLVIVVYQNLFLYIFLFHEITKLVWV